MGVTRGVVASNRISALSPAHYVTLPSVAAGSLANGNATHIYVPWPGRLVDVIVYQTQAGVGGTSCTVDVKNVAGTSLLSAVGVVTLASGADQVTNAKGDLALPAGWTRPVLKTDATVTVTKGTRLAIATVETGSYSTHATLQVTLIFEPLQ